MLAVTFHFLLATNKAVVAVDGLVIMHLKVVEMCLNN